jgi:hypothetical protein
MPDFISHPASYRDPSGFVFRLDGVYYRQVNRSYGSDFELLLRSGLYAALTKKGLLLSHSEVEADLTGHPERYKILLPEQVPLISYPDEWSPSQLRIAALLTLELLRIGLDHGMVLKDATPLNIQFHKGKAVFIDTLSFEKYDPAQPWVAYRQFCECFLYPLYLNHYLPIGTHTLSGAYQEGIPADNTAALLPWKTRLRLGVWLHVLLPARVRKDALPGGRQPVFDKTKLLRLTSHLGQILEDLGVRTENPSHWKGYYQDSILSPAYLAAKDELFRAFIAGITFASALDLGANDGYFSKILAEKATTVVAADSDWHCIDSLHRYTLKHPGCPILPLCVDITDPTPARGFANTERTSFMDRMPADLVVALALVHHLVLGRNIPLGRIAAYFFQLTTDRLILEFVPLSDPKAAQLRRNRKGEVPSYDETALEQAFAGYFTIERKSPVPGTERILYRMIKLVR